MTVAIKQNTPEWEEFRRTHLGASDAPVVMGVSPWKTAYQLWEEKQGFRGPQQQNVAMKRGHELEKQALKAYIDYTGNIATDEVVCHPEKPWMSASLDGLTLDRSLAIEIKCPGREDHFLASTNKVPEKYWPQLQHQLAVIGLNLLHYFSYSEDSFHLVEVERDEEYIKQLYAEEGDFWRRVQEFDPPAMGDKDFVVNNSQAWAKASQEWALANAELKRLKDKETECRKALIELANGKSVVGHGVKVQKVVRRGSVDYGAIPEIQGVDLEQYRKAPVETWRLKG